MHGEWDDPIQKHLDWVARIEGITRPHDAAHRVAMDRCTGVVPGEMNRIDALNHKIAGSFPETARLGSEAAGALSVAGLVGGQTEATKLASAAVGTLAVERLVGEQSEAARLARAAAESSAVARLVGEESDAITGVVAQQRRATDEMIRRCRDAGILDTRPSWLNQITTDATSALLATGNPLGQRMGFAERMMASVMPTPFIPTTADLVLSGMSPGLKRELDAMTGGLSHSLLSRSIDDLVKPLSTVHADFMGRLREVGVHSIGAALATATASTIARELGTAIDVVALGRQFSFNPAGVLEDELFLDAAIAIEGALTAVGRTGESTPAATELLDRVKSTIMAIIQSAGLDPKRAPAFVVIYFLLSIMSQISSMPSFIELVTGDEKEHKLDHKSLNLLENIANQNETIIKKLANVLDGNATPDGRPHVIGNFRATARLNVRASPGRAGRPLGRIDGGAVVVGLEERDNWVRIDFRPALSTEVFEGWVYRPYLAKIKSGRTPVE